jgi:quinol monooxygenase YgiN
MIRVLIERSISTGKENAFNALMREMRRDAVHAAGYISGETLRDVADPQHFVVISTWRAAPDWDAWAGSAVRAAVRERIRPMLVGEERVTVLEPA